MSAARLRVPAPTKAAAPTAARAGAATASPRTPATVVPALPPSCDAMLPHLGPLGARGKPKAMRATDSFVGVV